VRGSLTPVKKRSLALPLAAVVILLSFTALAGVGGGFSLPRYRAVAVGVAPYYAGAKAALIFRVDDFTVSPSLQERIPDSVVAPARWFSNYERDLIGYVTSRYPWLRITAGVITYCGVPGGCRGAWSLYSGLARVYGWEIASHSRYHARPPRSPSDYLGSLEDIEGNLTGYRPLTYIEPFGEASNDELAELYSHGVRVVCTTMIEPPVKPEVGDGLLKLGFTVKASDKIPWRSWLSSSLKLAMLQHGLVIVYTHATSYDWSSPSSLLEAVDYIAGLANTSSIWVTTPGELYSYLYEAEHARLEPSYHGGTLTVKVDEDARGAYWRIPLTLRIDTGGASVCSVDADGRPLRRLSLEHLGKPLEGYFVRDGVLYVSVVPPANVTVTLSTRNSRALLISSTVTHGASLIGEARLAAYTLWLPFAAVVVSAYRRGRVVRLVKESLKPCRVKAARYVVVIPARNSSQTIVEVIKSALGQTVRPVAVAVLDDASSDGTLEAILGLAEELGGLLLQSHDNGGYKVLHYSLPGGPRLVVASFKRHTGKSATVNEALRRIIRGLDYDYLLILDSDTVLEPDYAERLLANMIRGPRYSATNGLILLWRPDREGLIPRLLAGAFREVGSAILTLSIRVIESAAGALGGLNGAALMVEKRLLDELGGLPRGTTAEDAELTWRAHLAGYRVGVTPGAIAYTVDPGSLSGLARKFLRITTGTLESMARILPRLALRGRFKAFFSVLYNSLGGLPLALSLVHVGVLAGLAALGLHPQGLAYKLALLLPYTPLSMALTPVLKSPLGYLALAYLMAVVEATLLLTGLSLVYWGEPRVSRRLLRALVYVPIFPLVLWLSTLILLAAMAKAAAHYALGVHPDRW
jgi:cellulose synthase/poly-beta-1,6-N-acetylglucosamine synthase-like glycosyltransferase